jgi:hypothetical protein
MHRIQNVDLKFGWTQILLEVGIRRKLAMQTMSTLVQASLFIFAGCPVYWQNKLQTEIALSTVEAKYIAMSQALRETIPLATLMRKMNEIFPLYLPSPRFIIKVQEDNQSCIAMAENPKFTPQTKHIAIKYHHFWKHVITQANPDWFISLEYCSTHDQIVDIFTKPVRDDIFFKLRIGLMGW